jgi:RNA polymerase sigma factor (sigma-70 family)
MKYYREDVPYTKMTFEEERELFRKYYEEDDLEARDKIIFNHLRLAVMLAGRLVSRCGIPEDEAVSAANLGLMKAVTSKRFNPKSNVRFAAFARKHIIGGVLRIFKHRRSLIGPPIPDSDKTLERIAEEPISEQDAVEESDRATFLRAQLKRALRRLTPGERQSIEIVYVKGLTFQAAGESLGCSRQAVEQSASKGMEKLRTYLRDTRAFREEFL